MILINWCNHMKPSHPSQSDGRGPRENIDWRWAMNRPGLLLCVWVGCKVKWMWCVIYPELNPSVSYFILSIVLFLSYSHWQKTKGRLHPLKDPQHHDEGSWVSTGDVCLLMSSWKATSHPGWLANSDSGTITTTLLWSLILWKQIRKKIKLNGLSSYKDILSGYETI